MFHVETGIDILIGSVYHVTRVILLRSLLDIGLDVGVLSLRFLDVLDILLREIVGNRSHALNVLTVECHIVCCDKTRNLRNLVLRLCHTRLNQRNT